MAGLGEEPLGAGADKPESDSHARRRAAEACFQASLQVWAARLRGPLSEEAARDLERIEDECWRLFLEALKAPVQVRGKDRR